MNPFSFLFGDTYDSIVSHILKTVNRLNKLIDDNQLEYAALSEQYVSIISKQKGLSDTINKAQRTKEKLEALLA